MARASTKRLIAQARQALAEGNRSYALMLLREAHDGAPKDAAAAVLLARVLLAHSGSGGHAMAAIEMLAAHLALNPRSAEAARKLSDILASVTPVNFSRVNAAGLAAALRLDRVTADPLARAAGLLLAERGETPAFSPGTDESALLIALLEAAPVREPAVEGWLVARRRAALDSLAGPSAEQDEALLAAMARQTWLNEGVWPVTQAERKAVDRLDPADPAHGLAAALYLPAERWCPAGDGGGDGMPNALAGLAGDIRRERHEMARADADLGPDISAADGTGDSVAAQYEANPYPRWNWVQPPLAGAVRAFLDRIAGGSGGPQPDGGWTGGPLRILIAGCGTGRQAVEAALAYAPNARLLAFDFSRASLRYAAMKARRHRLDAIRFRQADILDLPDFDPPFDRPADLIECIGVLHHMADPFAGWRILLGRLRPGGLMYVGLYSATARRGLTALRERLAGAGIDPADPDAIRAVRARILARTPDGPEDEFERALADSADFYTLSEVRDLLFHAHERPLTLEAIGAFLEEEKLEFLHMDVRPHIAEAFAASLDGGHGESAALDLQAWAAFERDNPDTFDGMYLFWVRKPG